MKRITLFSIAFCLLATNAASAEVFSQDWNTPSDGILTYDNVNNREWLDMPFQSMFAPPRFDHVLPELGPGGLLAGFQIAGRNDVIALAQSAGITVGNSDLNINGPALTRLIDLLGEVFSSETGFRTTRALSNDVDEDQWRVVAKMANRPRIAEAWSKNSF